MRLMHELQQLLDAAGATFAEELTEQVADDLLTLVVNLHCVLDRAEAVIRLRQAKGRAALSPASADLLHQLYARGTALADILEEL
jgi:hypothetical protein